VKAIEKEKQESKKGEEGERGLSGRQPGTPEGGCSEESPE